MAIQNFQSLLFEALLGFAVYMLGLNALQTSVKRVARSWWGNGALQVMVFALLLGSFAFLSLPALAGYSLVGAILATLTVVSLSSLVQHSGSSESIEEWFGNDAVDILRSIPREPAINARVLRRIAPILRSRAGDVSTTRVSISVNMRDFGENPRLWMYDISETYTCRAGKALTTTLVWEIRPSWRPSTPYSKSQPAIPLEFGNPNERWHVTYIPPLSMADIEVWDRWMENITVEGLISGNGKQRNKIAFNRIIEEYTEVIESREVRSRSLRFIATVHFSPGTWELTGVTRGVLHPSQMSSFYMYAWHLCQGTFEFEITLSGQLAGRAEILSLVPITSLGDVSIPVMQLRESSARLSMEALPGSVILPQDAVVARLGPTQAS